MPKKTKEEKRKEKKERLKPQELTTETGLVETEERFSPSALKKTTRDTFVKPQPEQVTGKTIEEIQAEKTITPEVEELQKLAFPEEEQKEVIKEVPAEEQPEIVLSSKVPEEEQKEKRGFISKIFKTEEGIYRTDLAGQFEAETGQKLLQGSLPLGLDPATTTIQAAQAVGKARIVARVSNWLKNSNLLRIGLGKLIATGGVLFGLSKLVGTPDRRIRSLDQTYSQIRETLTFYPAAVKNGLLTPREAIEQLNDIQEEIIEMRAAIKRNAIFSAEDKLNPAFTKPFIQRSEKLLNFINLAKQDIVNTAANPSQLNVQELLQILKDIE